MSRPCARPCSTAPRRPRRMVRHARHPHGHFRSRDRGHAPAPGPVGHGRPGRGETVELYQYAAEEKGVLLSYTAETPLPVLADADRIRQVLANLLDNAVKYTPPGGQVVVTARTAGRLGGRGRDRYRRGASARRTSRAFSSGSTGPTRAGPSGGWGWGFRWCGRCFSPTAAPSTCAAPPGRAAGSCSPCQAAGAEPAPRTG